MLRNDFTKIIASIPLLGLSNYPGNSIYNSFEDKKKLVPKKLVQGDTIGLISPASAASEESFDKAIKNIENLGFKYKLADNLRKKNGYLAGNDFERVNDLNLMFADDEVDAVWCIRGGYGTTRILNKINFDVIKSNPKVFIGFSDITALHMAIYKYAGLVTFHGPVAASEFNEYTTENFVNILMNGGKRIINVKDNQREEGELFKPKVIVEGNMTGKLYGGNLCLISALAGTKYQSNTRGKIIFIEDIDEKPYRIDRMLTQLTDSFHLKNASGVLIGVMKGCEKDEDEKNSWTLSETLKDRLGNLGIPVFYGFSFGHIKNNCTLPVGASAYFDYLNQEINILEDVVK